MLPCNLKKLQDISVNRTDSFLLSLQNFLVFLSAQEPEHSTFALTGVFMISFQAELEFYQINGILEGERNSLAYYLYFMSYCEDISEIKIVLCT